MGRVSPGQARSGFLKIPKSIKNSTLPLPSLRTWTDPNLIILDGFWGVFCTPLQGTEIDIDLTTELQLGKMFPIKKAFLNELDTELHTELQFDTNKEEAETFLIELIIELGNEL